MFNVKSLEGCNEAGEWLRLESEREMGFEPTTFCLGSRRSATELLPLEWLLGLKYYDGCIP
jgi:hypothetical protein